MISADAHQFLRNVNVFKTKERQIDDDHHIDVRIFENRFGCAAVVFKGRGSDHVDRVFHGSRRGQERSEFFFCGVRDRRHHHAVLTDGVRGHDPGTAGIRDDRHTVTLGDRAVGKNLRSRKEFFQRKFTDHAALTQKGVGGTV